MSRPPCPKRWPGAATTCGSSCRSTGRWIECGGACEAFKLKLATAESCTGGLIAAYLTDIAGSSTVVERGFVTYSNEAKNEMLSIALDLIDKHGAVSESGAPAVDLVT